MPPNQRLNFKPLHWGFSLYEACTVTTVVLQL
ncbi:hypothetical protein S144_60 [Shewanella sp. phage 1/44]|nr:hypothetical protein S144_60 [Shewanella sp. phage 1/44]AHK11774.1 hypothetical protein S144_60 [Shewanella sp. phage 1/44]